jgi:hypothetical protein
MKIKKTIRITMDREEMLGALERRAREEEEIGYELTVATVEVNDDGCSIVFVEDE